MPHPVHAAAEHEARGRAPRRILPVLVLAQLAGTSTWFAVNAVMPELRAGFGWPAGSVATLTSAVQLGFILGALVFAVFTISDRFSTRRVFLLCSCAQAACTVCAEAFASSFPALCFWRALTGFFLAGIYPVGMKIAAQWFPKGLGAALGLLVGALVLGSASPHALRALSAGWHWATVLHAIALTALAAGALLFVLIPEPPPSAAPARAKALQLRALFTVMADRRARAAVLGYFGHMWELYTLWVLAPVIVATRLTGVDVSWAAFGTIGAGALGCAVGGRIATRVGSARVATTQLAVSGLCCLVSPWMLTAPLPLFLAWLLLWGTTAAGDSPQFSALTATHAPPALVGSVLTLTISIGFAISIISIQLFVWLAGFVPLTQLLPWLGAGPLLGLWALRPLLGR
ncbi:MAG: MFS transporter [Panacagrimonas sp.]